MPRALRWLRNGLYLLFLSLLLALAGLAGTWILVNQPAAVEAPDQVIQVNRGAGLGRIAAQLHEAGVIRHPLPFVLFAKLKGMAPRLQAGEYVLSAAMTPADILDALYLGKVRHLVLTVPEGATLRDIAVLAEAGGPGQPRQRDGAGFRPRLHRLPGPGRPRRWKATCFRTPTT